ncbi:serine protease [Vibrio sp. S9_S30]|uniref:S1 family peptidase n=1 Tax=Vibrio sp. S9_S30 TaxID=2720226 RepID=UPI0016807F4F|nr:serine protease [Vibrio sp. S9_S30]MBD1558788.1 serine protease [Vibrio sp. S9_S30]
MTRSVITLLAILPFASVASITVSPFIINGTYASTQDFPSIVNLYLDAFEYNQQYGSLYCGGTTLNANYVLTAAHCVGDRADVQLFTKVVPQLQYKTDYPSNVSRYQVSEIYIHPNWDSPTLKHDIAILKLESPRNIDVNNVAIKRPSNKNYAVTSSNLFVTVGHGITDSSSETESNMLQKTDLSFVDTATCSLAHSNVDSSYLCMTGARNPNTGLHNGACRGDSGGPVYIKDGNNNIQVGVTSFGNTICGVHSQVTTVYTDLYEHASWIDKVLSGSVNPTYTSTHAKRLAYFDETTGSSGSSFGLYSLAAICFMGYLRRRRVSIR